MTTAPLLYYSHKQGPDRLSQIQGLTYAARAQAPPVEILINLIFSYY
jgi:hypothetical protein